MATTRTTTWYCDTCHDEITDPRDALLAWKDAVTEDGFKSSDFRIVHKGKKCDYDNSMATLELADMLGPDGLAHLLYFLSIGPLKGPSRPEVRIVNMDQFVDIIRRLQTPRYEEARRYFSTSEVREEFADANEILPYTQQGLAAIIEIGREVA